MAWLDDHPPARRQFRAPRRESPSGVVVVHTAENTPDYVAFDGGAEAVASFIRNRSTAGSYHDLVDSDSAIQLVDYNNEAFHDATGSNRHSYGVSVATRADVWPLAPRAWRDGAIHQAAAATARYALWLRARTGIVIPARRITRAQSERRIPGFLSHAERDPARRHDPGEAFPWRQFLAEFARLTSQEEDDMTPAQEEKLDRVLASLTRVENEHFPRVARHDRLERLIRLLHPFGTEHIDREGKRGDPGDGRVEAPTWVRWIIELARGDRPRGDPDADG